jgi:acyl-coenzyme A thioesterase PaaI-like protein
LFVEATVTAESGTPVARSVGVVRVGVTDDVVLPPTAPACPIDPSTPLLPRRSGSAFTRRLGVMSATIGHGHAVLVLPSRADVTDVGGGMHEGALAALVDCAGGAAAWSIDGFDPSGRAATIGMHLWLRPDAGGRGRRGRGAHVVARGGHLLEHRGAHGADERPAGRRRLRHVPDRALRRMTVPDASPRPRLSSLPATRRALLLSRPLSRSRPGRTSSSCSIRASER